MKLGALAVSALALFGGLGCSATADEQKDKDPGSGGSAGSLGCTGSSDCFSRCVCENQNAELCVEACREGGNGGTGATGSGGTGATGSGGTGAVGSGGSGATGSGGGAGSGSGGTAGSGSGGTGGGGDQHQIITLKMDPFTIPAGAETFTCQSFANPMGSEGLVFVSTESFMTEGSHHMFLMEDTANRNGALETQGANCNGLNFATLVHSAQTPQARMAYPAGVGVRLRAGTGLRMLVHYLNTRNTPITPDVRVLLSVANPGEVTEFAAAIFGNVLNINVPPRSTGSAQGSCAMPVNIGLLNVTSHMHSHATSFTASVNGQQLYQTDEWDSPEPAEFNPPLNLAAGSRIEYRCEYDNPGTTPLTFGESARTNEMCIITGRGITPTGEPVSCLLGF